MSDVWPVYVVSRHRSENPKTARLLHESGIAFDFVVEPHDEAAYRDMIAREGFTSLVHTLDADDRGVAFARQGALNAALWRDERFHSAGWCWILDDDLTSFYRRDGRKMVKCSASEALVAAQLIISSVPRVAVGSLEYQQLAWSTTKSHALNSYCDVVVALNLSVLRKTGIGYDLSLRMKEDRDLVLQCLVRSYRSVRVQTYAFGAPKNGSNAGGCFDDYRRAELEANESAKMVKKWPLFCSPVTKSDGRPDVRVLWGAFKAAR